MLNSLSHGADVAGIYFYLFIILCYIMLCYVMLCYVMLCYVMLCYVMLCYVMLCYVMLCSIQTQILNYYKSAPLVDYFAEALFCTLTVILPMCSSASVCLIQFCPTAQRINFHTSSLDYLFIYLTFTRTCNWTGSVDIHFQIKSLEAFLSITMSTLCLVSNLYSYSEMRRLPPDGDQNR